MGESNLFADTDEVFNKVYQVNMPFPSTRF